MFKQVAKHILNSGVVVGRKVSMEEFALMHAETFESATKVSRLIYTDYVSAVHGNECGLEFAKAEALDSNESPFPGSLKHALKRAKAVNTPTTTHRQRGSRGGRGRNGMQANDIKAMISEALKTQLADKTLDKPAGNGKK